MEPINVFLAEDSALIQGLLNSYFRKTKNIKLVDTAANGEIAIEKLKSLKVDLIILDIVMPKLDGLATLKIIRKTDKKTPIIMYSSLTSDSAATHTVDALTYGATDYCQKPMGFGGKKLCADDSIGILIAKIETLVEERRKRKNIVEVSSHKTSLVPANHYDLITIGSSTGGPEALKCILSKLGGQLPPVLITQHMPEKFTRLLANNLNNLNHIKVIEGVSGEKLKPGYVYIAPGNYHMTIKKSTPLTYEIELNQDEQVNSCRPSVDVMFNSVADTYSGKILSIILTGMGNDGLNGCRSLKQKKNIKLVIQNKETSTVWGMPAAVHEAGIYDCCLPLLEIQNLLYRVSCKGNK